MVETKKEELTKKKIAYDKYKCHMLRQITEKDFINFCCLERYYPDQKKIELH